MFISLKERSRKSAAGSWRWLLVVLVWIFIQPARAANDPILAWSASADSSVTGYVVYYGKESGNYPNRLDLGTNLTAVITGLDAGMTYYFAVADYDASGAESDPSGEISFTVPASSPPLPTLVLTPIADQTIVARKTLVLTNSTAGSSGTLSYSLLAGPAGMQIFPTTGVLFWTPACSQGGSSNLITVMVIDDSNPPQFGVLSFNVSVADAVELTLGSVLAGQGQNGSVVLNARCSGPVTNLSFTLDTCASWVSTVRVQSLLPFAIVTQDPPGAAHSVITVQTTDGQTLQGGQALLQINFTTAVTQSSGFSSFQVSGVSAWLADGSNTPTAPDTSAAVTVIGNDALLQMQMISGQRGLTVYGPVGGSYYIQSTADLSRGTWSNEFYLTLTSLSQIVNLTTNSAPPMKFYRTVRAAGS